MMQKVILSCCQRCFGENWQNCLRRSHPGNNKM